MDRLIATLRTAYPSLPQASAPSQPVQSPSPLVVQPGAVSSQANRAEPDWLEPLLSIPDIDLELENFAEVSTTEFELKKSVTMRCSRPVQGCIVKRNTPDGLVSGNRLVLSAGKVHYNGYHDVGANTTYVFSEPVKFLYLDDANTKKHYTGCLPNKQNAIFAILLRRETKTVDALSWMILRPVDTPMNSPGGLQVFATNRVEAHLGGIKRADLPQYM